MYKCNVISIVVAVLILQSPGAVPVKDNLSGRTAGDAASASGGQEGAVSNKTGFTAAGTDTEKSISNRVFNGTFDAGLTGWWPAARDLQSHAELVSDENGSWLQLIQSQIPNREMKVFSSLFAGDKPQVYVKFRARGNGRGRIELGGVSPQASMSVFFSEQTFDLGQQWDEHTFMLPVQKTQLKQCQLVFSATERMDIDDITVSLEPPGSAKIEPSSIVEAGLECAEPSGIFFTGEVPQFITRVADYRSDKKVLQLSYQVISHKETLVSQGSFSLPTGRSIKKSFDIPVREPGYYRVQWSLGDAVKGDSAFVITTRPSGNPDPRFALCVIQTNPREFARAIERMGAGSLRLIGPFIWGYMQPQPDQWFVDTEVLRYLKEKTGAELMALVTGAAPKWLSGQNSERFSTPLALTMLEKLVLDAGPLVQSYEIYNEPNGSFPGSASDYAKYLAGAYDLFKTKFPDKTVVGIDTSNINLDYIRSVLDSGAQGKMDVLSFHPYRVISPEVSTLQDEVSGVRKLADSAANPPRLWATEIGFQCNDFMSVKPNRYPSVKIVSEAAAARYMTKMNLMLLAGGVERMYWFLLNGVGELPNPFYYGFYYENPERMIPKKEVAAFCHLSRALACRPFMERIPAADEQLYLYRFGGRGADGTQALAFFKSENANKPRCIFLRTKTPPEHTDIYGAPLAAIKQLGDICIIGVNNDPAYLVTENQTPIITEFPFTITRAPETVTDGADFSMELEMQNIFSEPLEMAIESGLPDGWTCSEGNSFTVRLVPGEKKSLKLSISVPSGGGGAPNLADIIFSVSLQNMLDTPYIVQKSIQVQLKKYLNLEPRKILATDVKWRATAPNQTWAATALEDAVQCRYKFISRNNVGGKASEWGKIETPFLKTEDFKGYRKLLIDVKFTDPSAFTFSVVFSEENGALYRAIPNVEAETRGRWQTVTVDLGDFTPMGAVAKGDDNGRLDLDRIKSIAFVGNSFSDSTGSFSVRSLMFIP